MSEGSSFRERLAGRVRAAGVFALVEEPMTIVRIGTVGLFGGAASASLFALVFWFFEETMAAWLSAALAAAYGGIWIWWIILPGAGQVRSTMWAIVAVSAGNELAVHLVLGGFGNSGGYLGWGVAVVMMATLALSRRSIVMLSLGFAGVLLGFGFLESTLAAGRTAPDAGLTTFLWVAVISGNVALLVILFTYLLGRLRAERARAEGLLLNVLPATVASELKRHGTTQALRFDEVSVLFADIVGFTPMSVEMAPEEMVAELNRVFSFFDSLVDRYACEKIRTVGDNYMVACGVPTPRREHADAAARIALAMIEHSEGGRFRFRIGINSGPVVAGVIGRRKFQYDVWGDTVNTASRMESHGLPGKIQITETTRHLLGDRYVCVPRGPVEIKGKGVLETWFLEGVQEP